MGTMLYALLFVSVAISSAFCDDLIVKIPDESNLQQPCSDADLNCVRRQFLNNGWCDAVSEPVNRQTTLVSLNEIYQLPVINSTIHKNVYIDGLANGQVVQFFINKNTNKAVFSTVFKNLHIHENCTFHLHRRYKEDIVVSAGHTTEFYPSVTVTTVISGLNTYAPVLMQSTAYIDVIPKFSFGWINESLKNPDVFGLIRAIEQNIFGCYQELDLVRGPKYAEFFISNVICNQNYNPN